MAYCKYLAQHFTPARESQAQTYRKYLADGNVDVRLATENVLSEFLREIRCIAEVQEKQAEVDRQRREARAVLRKRPSKQTLQDEGNTDGQDGEQEGEAQDVAAYEETTSTEQEWEGEGSGLWQPGQGVFIDHAAIMDIIIQHLSYPGKFSYALILAELTVQMNWYNRLRWNGSLPSWN